IDRTDGVLEVRLLELAEAVLQLDVDRLVVLRTDDGDLPAENIGELLPLLVPDIDAVEARERARLIASRVEDAHVGRDGLLVVLDLVFVELTDLLLDPDPLVSIIGELELLLVDL